MSIQKSQFQPCGLATSCNSASVQFFGRGQFNHQLLQYQHHCNHPAASATNESTPLTPQLHLTL